MVSIIFSEHMKLMSMRYNVHHRQAELLLEAELQNVVSRLDYLHLKTQVAIKKLPTRGYNLTKHPKEPF